MFETGDLVKFVYANDDHHGIVVQMKVPPRDWRYKHRLPNSGVEVLWNTGEMFWCAYRELEKIAPNACKSVASGV